MRKRPYRGRRRGLRRRLLTPELLESRRLLAADPIISEFMASNQETLPDGDGRFPDWIEIYNAGDQPIDLAGFHLTDTRENPRRWTFPSIELPAAEQLVVYASGEDDADYVDSQGNLHTTFRLRAGGEYVALASPDGQIVSEFGDSGQDYPRQFPDVSFGIVQAQALVDANSPAHWHVPLDGRLGTQWTAMGFDAASSGFSSGTAAAGYEDRPGDRNNFVGQFTTELPSGIHGVYTRVEFEVDDVSTITALKLSMKYDNGFAAYVNGVKVAEENVPPVLDWFSAAPDGARRDRDAIRFVEYDLDSHIDRLVDGTNVLAIHGINNLVRDRSDFLVAPRLVAGITASDLPVGYLRTPTPGEANISLQSMAGPLIEQVTENPGVIGDQQDVTVTAKLTSLNAPVDSAALSYRVMYEPPITVPMVDDGTGPDTAAGDGIYTATIPHTAAEPGQMLRWFVTAHDSEGNGSRSPNDWDQSGQSRSPEYFGTVVSDSSIETPLPVIQWFVETPRLAETGSGTRSSVFYDGQFYDNVFVRIRGGTARGWPKKSYKVEFNDGHFFQLHEDLPRVDEINLNATYTDKSYVRAVLTSEFQNDAGTPSPESFLVRVQQNREFYSVAIVVEQPDRAFLRRHGLDDEGALYKGGPGSSLASISGLEKKTDRPDGPLDARELVDGLKLQGDELEHFLFDNVNISALINFMATNVITQNIDASDKNYYLHRDSDGTGEWQMLPWDLDLTFGPDALNTDTMLADERRVPATTYRNASHPLLGSRRYTLHAGKFNELEDRIITNPRTREMFVRRIRTLADEYLATDYFTSRIDELVTLLAADVELDKARWRGNAHFGSRDYTLVDATERIKNEYLAIRLPYLTSRQGELTERQGGVGIPEAQVGNPTIVFGAIDFAPTSSDQDEEYIELVNANPVSVDISGWQLTGGVEFTFRPGTVIPAGQSLYVSPNVSVFRSRAEGVGGNQGLFVQGGYEGHISSDGEPLSLVAADGTVVQRTFAGGQPSDVQRFLRITEVNYHPHNPNPIDGLGELDDGTESAADQFEFIELTNTGDVALDLTGTRFSQGVDLVLPAGTTLGPGHQAVIVRDRTAFQSRYGNDANILGEYTGTLDDVGDRIFLDDADQRSIHAIHYEATPPWPDRADGRGSTLVVVDPDGDYDDPSNWQISTDFGGSPGRPSSTLVDRVVINEVLAHATTPQADAIELYNAGGTDTEIGSWYLSNSDEDYFRFRIPEGSTLPGLGYVVFEEGQLGFGLDQARGDEVWLIAGDSTGKPLRFVTHAQFGPTPAGVSQGPWPSQGDSWIPLAQPTLGAANAAPYVGDVVISELHYHPIDPDGDREQVPDDFEFVELFNRTNVAIDLTDWQLTGGAQFTFPHDTTIDAGEALTVVAFDPSDRRAATIFQFTMGLPTTARLIGPFEPSLDDARGAIRIVRPDASPQDEPSLIPLVPVDELIYQSDPPWPMTAAGGGDALARTAPDVYGNLPIAWVAASPSPGTVHFVGRRPGDANQDGRFDQADILLVLQAAKYDTGDPADWTEGDWNGDGRFDSLDLVLALQVDHIRE